MPLPVRNRMVTVPVLLLAAFIVLLAAPCRAEYRDNGDGTVLDTETGLVWDKNGLLIMERNEAEAYCRSSMAAGREGWRLPLAEELLTLLKDSLADPDFIPELECGLGGVYWVEHGEALQCDSGVVTHVAQDFLCKVRCVNDAE